MLRIETYDCHTPTSPLAAVLRKAVRELFEPDPGRKTADVLLLPRPTEDWARGTYTPTLASPNAWYDLYFCHPTVRTGRDEVGPGNVHAPGFAVLDKIGTLAPPRLIPAEKRIAAAEPVSLDGVSEDQIRLAGGPEEMLRILTDRRDAAIRADRSTAAYDWAELADRVLATLRTLDPPPLTAGQRALAGSVRLLEAQGALPSARDAVVALLRNAEDAGAMEEAAAVRDLLEEFDPDTLTRTRRAPGGRPPVGAPVPIRMSEELRGWVQEQAVGGESLARVVRRLLEDARLRKEAEEAAATSGNTEGRQVEPPAPLMRPADTVHITTKGGRRFRLTQIHGYQTVDLLTQVEPRTADDRDERVEWVKVDEFFTQNLGGEPGSSEFLMSLAAYLRPSLEKPGAYLRTYRKGSR